MLMEIKRNIQSDKVSSSTGSLFINPANIMTLETSIGFIQTDTLGKEFDVELHLILNQKDYLICRKPIKDMNDIDNSEALLNLVSEHLERIEVLKKLINSLKLT